MPLALVARATITAINPASGTAEPGETVTATVSVDPSLLGLCLTGTSSDLANIQVAFDPACGPGGPFADPWESEMQVTVGGATAPGAYTITIIDPDLGGLIYQWPLTVTGPPVTTTTTTTTSVPTTATTTTTVPSPTTSSTTPTTTSTTTGSVTATTRPGATTTTSPGDKTPTTTNEGGLPPVGPGGPTGPGSPDIGDDGVGPPPAPDDDGVIAAFEPASAFSEVALSSGLIDAASRTVPTIVAEAVLSPLVVLEILLRALGRTTAGLLLPLVLTALLGLGLFWRMRPRDDDWEPDSLLGRESWLEGAGP